MRERFIDKYTSNKQRVMNEMYYTVILPSEYPFRPLRRVFRHGIVGENNTVFSYEINPDKEQRWYSKTENSKTNILNVERRLRNAGYPAKISKTMEF